MINSENVGNCSYIQLLESKLEQMQTKSLAMNNSFCSSAFVAGYWAGAAVIIEAKSSLCEAEDRELDIDADPGPVSCRRNPAGIYVAD